ncbi:MAG: DegV family protein [Chloroflexi bacterium HGW-Chloroflexi-6]|nr:MAG: DegV family protein [Chloroflexi bacterium HGW-Chloroflexi-6]
MAKVALVTDSTSSLPTEYLKRYNITVVPQVLIWGEKMYEDGIDIQPDEFYQKLSGAKVIPTTSQVSVINMKNAFEQLLAEGYEILGMFLSSKLSGTVQSAVQGRESLSAGKDKVHIVDTETTSMSMGFQVLTVARAASEGASTSECKALAEKAHTSTGIFFMVDTLEFLHRGGRIGGAQRLLGTALNLKPILTVKDGKIEAVERVRTKGKALDRLVELVSEHTKGKNPIRLASLSANAEADAKSVLTAASLSLQVSENIATELSPVLGTHTGPGTVGIAYMAGL